jgi:hypothetical protein
MGSKNGDPCFPRRAALLAVCCLLGCGGGGAPRWACRDFGSGRLCERAFAPPPGDGWTCYAAAGDVICARASWGPGSSGWTCARAGAAAVCRLPGGAQPDEPAPDGWQAAVHADIVTALWRRAGNDPWRCAEPRCAEHRPDRPSADEWECVDGDGRVLCRGRFLRDVDPRWSCAAFGERFLCLDPDPDYPDPAAPTAWKCFYDDSLRTGRECTRVAPATDGPCPGAWAAERCLLLRTVPECWLNTDCAGGRSCRVGFCVPS